MLFTSWIFILAYLPVAVLGFGFLSHFGRTAGAAWLVVMSLVFYGFWQPSLILLISISIVFNFSVASAIRRYEGREKLQNLLLLGGISANLIALIYYKYAFWLWGLISNSGLVHLGHIAPIVLPLGISFFTFTQIGYLVDCRQKVTKENGFLNYVLFVTFFPHLIAGPILHNGEIMPQFSEPDRFGLKGANLGAGLTMFVIGVLKKALIADSLSAMNNVGFADAQSLHFFGSWGAALGYSVQLYFDFSGYSDMAVGLALMFNIKFPVNFNSPYKARSIIEFWQRWHMTLTRYITLYLYNPIAMALSRRRMARGLPMGRKALAKPGPFLQLVALPTFITMALAGVWHGAGAQFLVFGLLHASYLSINHAWRAFGPKIDEAALAPLKRRLIAAGYFVLTYMSVLVAQVFFKAASVSDALSILGAMFGFEGVERPLPLPKALRPLLGHMADNGSVIFHMSPDIRPQIVSIIVGYLLIALAPNSQQIMAYAEPVLGKIDATRATLLQWRPTLGWAVIAACAAVVALMSIGGTHEFLYFQF